MTFSLRFVAHSEVGRVRKNNQDAAYASPTLLVVADGMGGAAAGDLASAVAALEAAESDGRFSAEDMLDHMAGIVERANDRLHELVMADPLLDGMGTTFCGAAFSGEQLGIAHIGDSRCYQLRDGQLTQLTHDHSWVQALIDEGRLTPDQAAVHPHRSLILKVLNGHSPMDPDYEVVDVQESDRYLFCSDGLSGMVDDASIAAAMALADPEQAVARLAREANDAGGHDNITVVLADVVPHDDTLSTAAAVLVGSAVEREIPPLEKLAAEYAASLYPPLPAESDPRDHGDSEQARYAPVDQEPRRWPGVLAAVVAIALLMGGATWGVVSYSQSRYFIAETDGSIGIYNGLPGSLLGWELNHLVEMTPTRVEDLPSFYRRAVTNTIGVDSHADARQTASRLAMLAETCVQVRADRQNRPTPTPSPTPTLTGLSTSQPNYPTFLAPITPTGAEEADPEAC